MSKRTYIAVGDSRGQVGGGRDVTGLGSGNVYSAQSEESIAEEGFRMFDRARYIDSKNVVFGNPVGKSDYEITWKHFDLDTGPYGRIVRKTRVKGENNAKQLARRWIKGTVARVRPRR
jgi:hypothetical protein